MVGNGPIISFINDSLCFIEHSNTTHLPKIERCEYRFKVDTLFEETPSHGSRKWLILKLTEDSLVIKWDRVTARYYRLY